MARTQYAYQPSEAAAVAFTVMFSISTLIHVYQSFIFRRRKAWFMTPFIIGGVFEIVGYIGRTLSAEDPQAQNPFIIQTLMILLGPALMAAAIYMTLGRIIQLTRGEKFALIRRKWLTTIFVTGDVLSFIAQAIGGGMISSSKGGNAQEQADTKQKGKTVILVGLWIQIIFFGFFVLVSVLFQFRGRKYLQKLDPALAWRKHMYTLYVVSSLILIRSIYRVIEYIQGLDGYIYSHEVFLYVFDAALMLIAMSIMNVVHPAGIAEMLREENDAPSYEGVVEMDRLEHVETQYDHGA